MTDEKQALMKCADWCSRCEHCVSEVRDKLRKMQIEPDAAQRIVDYLLKERYIDELRYATFFVRDKARFNGWGPIKIRYALQAKGIARSTIDAALDEAAPADNGALLRALQSKLKSAKPDADPWKLKASLVRLGVSRGFAYDEVAAAADKLKRQWLDEE